MPGYRAIRPGDLIAVRTTDPRYAEAHVVLDVVADNGGYLLLSGPWGERELQVLIRRVGAPTLNQLEN